MTDLLSEARDSRASDCPACPGEPVTERIDARTAEVGRGLVVRRAIPSPARRMVGAWCFLDHAGPKVHGPGDGIRVGPHPHIGLQTFTWMIDGEVLHRDSLGCEQLIRPGQVNLMTAGRGIAHSEESPADAAGTLHAAQLWIALPDAERHREPAFDHHPELPSLVSGGFRVTVLAGTALGETSPARVYSPLVGVDLCAGEAADTTVGLDPSFEHAALCLAGAAEVAGERIEPGTLLYLGTGRRSLPVTCDAAAQLLVVGGEPFDEDVLVWWNFVARTRDEMIAATEDWNAGRRFGAVPGTRLDPLPAPEVARLRARR